MSRTDDLFALFGKSVSRDPTGRNARLHFFGSIPFDDGTRVNLKDGSRISAHGTDAHEHPQSAPLSPLRPTVVALVSVNGGVAFFRRESWRCFAETPPKGGSGES